MHKYFYSVRSLALLQSVTDEDLQHYFDDGSFRTYEFGKNQIVHNVDELCCLLEIILSGRIVIEHIDSAGNLVSIAEFNRGDILGGNLLFSKTPRYPMTVTAKDRSVFLLIEKQRLFRLFSDNHEFLSSYLEYISEHAAILGDRIRLYVNHSIRESVLVFLNEEYKKQHTETLMLPISKKALAERIGVQRTSLSRELAKMRQEELITFSGKHIRLLPLFFSLEIASQ